MPVMQTEFSCPRCKAAGVSPLPRIVANAGELQCSTNGTHRWNDTNSFFAENPSMDFEPVVPKNLPQENYEPFQLSIPIGLKGKLQERFGEKMQANAVSILMQMAEGNMLIIGQTDLDRLKAKLGKAPDSSAELFGLVYAMTEQVAEFKEIADNAEKEVQAYEGLNRGRVVIDLGDQLQSATDKARSNELPLKLWITKVLKEGIENNWW